jgi:hypothetical protein
MPEEQQYELDMHAWTQAIREYKARVERIESQQQTLHDVSVLCISVLAFAGSLVLAPALCVCFGTSIVAIVASFQMSASVHWRDNATAEKGGWQGTTRSLLCRGIVSLNYMALAAFAAGIVAIVAAAIANT